MQASDFWGVVVPTWLGALGSVGASAIAVIAYITSRAARGGVQEIAAGLNRGASAEGDGASAPDDAQTLAPTMPWSMETRGDGAITFRNNSSVEAALVDITSESPLVVRFELPLRVPSGASFDVLLHRTLGGPAVAGIGLEWELADGRRGKRTFYL